jgi:hypothetical protein
MWTQEHRRIYRREGEGYPSDLRDAEWARLEPLIPGATPGGRPRKTDHTGTIEQRLAAMTPVERARDAIELMERVRTRLAALRTIEHEPMPDFGDLEFKASATAAWALVARKTNC